MHPGSQQPIWAAKAGAGSTIKKDNAAIYKMVDVWNIFQCYVTGHPENTQLTPALSAFPGSIYM